MNLNKVTLKEPSILVVRNHDIQALFMGYSIKRVKGISWWHVICIEYVLYIYKL